MRLCEIARTLNMAGMSFCPAWMTSEEVTLDTVKL